jgi:hypothetical protein
MFKMISQKVENKLFFLPQFPCAATDDMAACPNFLSPFVCTTKVRYSSPNTGHQGPRGGVEVQLYSFLTSALGRGGWSAPRPGHFTPGKEPVPFVQEAGWAPGPVWTCSPPLGFDPPDHPAHSKSLY